MPTKRKSRSRNLRRNPASGAIEDYVHCKITEEEFSEIWGNRFATPFDKNLDTGKLALEVWQRDGEQLLQAAGFTGITRHPEFKSVLYYGDIHENLKAMLSTYGTPWENG